MHGFGQLDEGFKLLINGNENGGGEYVLGTSQKIDVQWQLSVPGEWLNL